MPLLIRFNCPGRTEGRLKRMPLGQGGVSVKTGVPSWGRSSAGVGRTGTFLSQLGTTRRTARTRLQTDYNRALRVVAEIDAARTTMN
ncbi:hypothetical protein ACVWZD_005605 [Streptomyces sp. TE3672]